MGKRKTRRSQRLCEQNNASDEQTSTDRDPTLLAVEDTSPPTGTTPFGRESGGRTPSRQQSPALSRSVSPSARNVSQTPVRSPQPGITFGTLMAALRELENRLAIRQDAQKADILATMRNELRSKPTSDDSANRLRADDYRTTQPALSLADERIERQRQPIDSSPVNDSAIRTEDEDSPRSVRLLGVTRNSTVDPMTDLEDRRQSTVFRKRVAAKRPMVTSEGPLIDEASDGERPHRRARSHRSLESSVSMTTIPKLCDKYIGFSHDVSVVVWLDMFDALTLDWTDRERLRALPRHLGNEAIEWFSQDIVPRIATITWPEAKRLMTDRFDVTIANPINRAIHRKLSSRESVTDYFNDKRRQLVRSGASPEIQVELLTEGMPEYYKPLIQKSQRPEDRHRMDSISALMFQRTDRPKTSHRITRRLSSLKKTIRTIARYRKIQSKESRITDRSTDTETLHPQGRALSARDSDFRTNCIGRGNVRESIAHF